MSYLKIDRLSKSYGNVIAVKDFSLLLDNKAFVVIAGPSGCGKTTLLQIIAGLIPQDSGSIIIDNRDITEEASDKRNVSMVFQDAALFPHMNIFNNIAYGLTYMGISDEEIKERVVSISKLLGIDSLMKRKPATLSGGEQQRVSIARALVRHPRIFLMDEPLSSLDARLRSQLKVEFLQLYRILDASFFYVTHDQSEAMTMADILIIMKDGMIQQMGTPNEIYNQPVNMFTASFLGKYELNKVSGCIRNQCLYWNGRRLELKSPCKDMEVVIGIREQYVFFDDAYGIESEVILIEDIGDECYFHLRYIDGTIVMKNSSHKKIKVGEIVKFNFHWRDVYIFHKETGKRVYI